MADITNLSSFLGDVADAIRSKKGSEESIPAKNFDEEILSIETGIDTSDADATEENIEKGKTAYVNGLKVTGTLADAGGSADIMVSADNISVGNQRGWDCVSTTYTNSGKKIHKDGWYVNQHMKFEDLAPALGVTADKIVAGNTILGIEGTAESGGVTTSGVKLFETIDDMQADTTAEEGDLAVTYGEETTPFTSDVIFSGLLFKNTVTLDAAVTTSSYAYLYDENEDYETQYQIRISSTYFYIRDYYSGDYIVRYTSTDGMTYTLNSGYESTYIFSQPMHFSGTWNADYGKFMDCGGMYFYGIYEYKPYIDNTEIHLYPISAIKFDRDDTQSQGINNVRLEGEPLSTIYKLSDLQEVLAKLLESSEVNPSSKPTSMWLALDGDGDLIFMRAFDTSTNTIFRSGYFTLAYDNTGNYIGTYDGSTSSHTSYRTYKIDLSNKTYSLKKNYTGTTTSGLSYAISGIDITTLPLEISSTYASYGSLCLHIYTTTYEGKGHHSISNDPGVANSQYIGKYKYFLAPTQFTLNASNQLLPGKIAYGANGIVIGDDSVYENVVNTGDIDNLVANIFGIEDINGLDDCTVNILTKSSNVPKTTRLNISDKTLDTSDYLLINDKLNECESVDFSGETAIRYITEID